jgi:hypothetical protein
MSHPARARRIRAGFLRVGLWASAAAFVAIEGYALPDQWLIGHASVRFMLGTALLSAGACIGLFALISAIGFAVSLFFGESAGEPMQDPSGSVGATAWGISHPRPPLRGGRRSERGAPAAQPEGAERSPPARRHGFFLKYLRSGGG